MSQHSHIKKRSIQIGTRQTSVALEEEFSLKEIARERQLSLNKLLTDINERRTHANLSSTILLHVLKHYQELAERGRDC